MTIYLKLNSQYFKSGNECCPADNNTDKEIKEINHLEKNAIIIGNSDGIGLAATERLLDDGWNITGISRSTSRLKDPKYKHLVTDVQDSRYPEILKAQINKDKHIDLCMYCAGIGDLINFDDLARELTIVEVNLMGMLKSVAVVMPEMIQRKRGHFIGLSSVADVLISGEAPSYHASKAAFSNYLEGLARAVQPYEVSVTNLRFGFVDTKMAKGDVKPFMMSVNRATEHIIKCMQKKPVRYTAPRIVIPLVAFRKYMMRLGSS